MEQKLKKINIRIILATFALTTLALPTIIAHAATIYDPLQGKTFQDLINNIVKFANSILAPLSTLMVLIAGFLYMTGGGNPEKIKTAHKVLIWALVGIGIVLLANGAEAIIRSILGVSR